MAFDLPLLALSDEKDRVHVFLIEQYQTMKPFKTRKFNGFIESLALTQTRVAVGTRNAVMIWNYKHDILTQFFIPNITCLFLNEIRLWLGSDSGILTTGHFE